MLWAFFIYGIAVLLAGFYSYTKNKTTESLMSCGKIPFVSAQLSVYGIIFVITVPIYAAVKESSVTGILCSVFSVIGVTVSFLLIGRRLRVYSELSGHSKTLPEFLENRFDDNSGVLRSFCGSVLLVFGILLSSSVLVNACKLISVISEYEQSSLIVIIGAFSIVYIALGGLSGVGVADILRGILFVALMLFMIVSVIDPSVFENSTVSDYVFHRNFTVGLSEQNSFLSAVIPAFGCLLLFIGLPQTNVRFMYFPERRYKKRTLILSVLPVFPVAVGSFIFGFYASSDCITFEKIVEFHYFSVTPILGIIFVIAEFSALMSVADSSIAIASTALSHDLLGDSGKAGTVKLRLCFFIVGISAVLFSLFGTVSMPEIILSPEFLLATLSAAFAPTVIFCLYSKIITSVGAVFSIAVGIVSSVCFYYFAHLNGIESLPMSFVISTAVLFAVSALDRRKPSAKILNEYGRTVEIVRMK